ncbi:MAG: hypothetical protein ACP5O8_03685 [Candidatus Aenigmatarchaeota archaeon]
MSFLKPDTTFIKIILQLNEEEILTRRSVAKIVEPEFPYIPRPEKFKLALRGADSYAKILERCGYAIKLSYRGREYSLQITEKGKEAAKRLKESGKDESS